VTNAVAVVCSQVNIAAIAYFGSLTMLWVGLKLICDIILVE